MKFMTKILPMFFLLLASVGCETAQITGYKDPAFQNFVSKKMVVIVDIGNTMKRVNYESTAEKIITKNPFRRLDLNLYQSNQLFPPTREWTNADTKKIFDEKQIDSYLVISLSNVNQSAGATVTTFIQNVALTSRSTIVSGDFEAVLYDVNGKKIWITNCTISDKNIDADEMVEQGLKKIANYLYKDKLVVTKK